MVVGAIVSHSLTMCSGRLFRSSDTPTMFSGSSPPINPKPAQNSISSRKRTSGAPTTSAGLASPADTSEPTFFPTTDTQLSAPFGAPTSMGIASSADTVEPTFFPTTETQFSAPFDGLGTTASPTADTRRAATFNTLRPTALPVTDTQLAPVFDASEHTSKPIITIKVDREGASFIDTEPVPPGSASAERFKIPFPSQAKKERRPVRPNITSGQGSETPIPLLIKKERPAFPAKAVKIQPKTVKDYSKL